MKALAKRLLKFDICLYWGVDEEYSKSVVLEPSGHVPAAFPKLHQSSSTTLDLMNFSRESPSFRLVIGVQMPAPMQGVGDGGKETPA